MTASFNFVSEERAKRISSRLLKDLEGLPSEKDFKNMATLAVTGVSGNSHRRAMRIRDRIEKHTLYTQIDKSKNNGTIVMVKFLAVEGPTSLVVREMLILVHKTGNLSFYITPTDLTVWTHAIERFYQRAHTLKLDDLVNNLARARSLWEGWKKAIVASHVPNQLFLPTEDGIWLGTIEPATAIIKTFLPYGKAHYDKCAHDLTEAYAKLPYGKPVPDEDVHVIFSTLLEQHPWLAL